MSLQPISFSKAPNVLDVSDVPGTREEANVLTVKSVMIISCPLCEIVFVLGE